MMEYISKDIEQIAQEAIAALNRNKQLNLTFYDLIEDIFHSGEYHLQIVASNGDFIHTNFYGGELTEPRKPEENQRIPFNDLLVIRLAKKIFDDYKEHLARQAVDKNTISNTANQTVDGTLTVSKLNIGNAVYSISDSRVDNLTDKLTDLEQKNQELEDELDALKKELQNKDAMIRVIWDTMTDKGMFK